jgi:hypothetical protein
VLWGNNGKKRQGISKTHPAVNGGQIPLDNFPPDTNTVKIQMLI